MTLLQFVCGLNDMCRRLEHHEAAKDEAAKLGASITITRGGKHFCAVISINGKQRKVFLSGTPRDVKVCHVVREDVRKKIEEMRK